MFHLRAQLTCLNVLQAALLNSPRQRRKGQKGTPTMKGQKLSHPLQGVIFLCIKLILIRAGAFKCFRTLPVSTDQLTALSDVLPNTH